MTLDDYINEIQNPPKKKVERVTFSALDLDSYPNISSKKKQLLREVFSHLDKDSFHDAFYRHEHNLGEYAYYCSQSDNGQKGLVQVKICDLMTSYDVPKKIPFQDFIREYNRCVKAGAQAYCTLVIQTYHNREDSEFDRNISIHYTTDCNVFLNYLAAAEIERLQEDELGRLLANACIDHENNARRYKEFQKKKEAQKVIEKSMSPHRGRRH